jgi:hypothetical protein
MIPSSNKKILFRFLLGFAFCFSFYTHAQSTLISKLQLTESVPADLLASRSVVLFNPAYAKRELEEVQKSFAQIGVDAEAYIEVDVILASKDITRAYATYLTSREIKFLILLDKDANGYRLVVMPFNNTASLVDVKQLAWTVNHSSLRELLMTVYRNSWISQKKQNFLINETPETNISVNTITGRRSEFFAVDLKVDALAVPFFGEANADTALYRMMKELYPYKYKLTPAESTDEELRKKGFIFVLCEIQTRGVAAKQLLGYDMTRAESAYVSTTFPNGVAQLRTIPAEKPIYKFYVKHISSGNIFLGTKWDADVSLEQALKNHIKGFKAELKIE